jgi:hydrogenase-4 component E
LNYDSTVYLISASILVSAFYIQGQRYIMSMIRGQLVQSVLIAAASFLLAYIERSTDLLILGLLILILRGILITYMLETRMPRRKSYVFEEGVNVPYLFLVDLVFIVITVFIIYSIIFSSLVPISQPGNSSTLLFPLLLFFQGLFLITSRRSTYTQIVGYVEEENGLVLLAIFLLPVPIIIEASVFLDVLALVVISSVITVEKSTHERMEELRG